jgi:tetratricopeptide (TPR) repeat protein
MSVAIPRSWFARLRTSPAIAALVVAILYSQAADAQGVGVSEATRAQAREADQHFRKGNQLYKKGDLEAAIRSFKLSFDIVANPESGLMIARAYRDFGLLRDAHRAYKTAIPAAREAAAHHKKYKKALDTTKKELRELEQILVKLSIELVDAPSGTDVFVNEELIPESELARPIMVAPGELEVLARSRSGREVRKAVARNAGQSASVTLSFAGGASGSYGDDIEVNPFGADEMAEPQDKTKEDGGLSRSWAYLAGGLGVAGMATFGVFGAISQSKFDSLEQDCTNAHCPPNRESDIDQGKQFQTIANIGLGVGIVGLTAGTVLFLVSDSPSEKKGHELAIGLGSIQVRGRF